MNTNALLPPDGVLCHCSQVKLPLHSLLLSNVQYQTKFIHNYSITGNVLHCGIKLKSLKTMKQHIWNYVVNKKK